MAVSFTTVAVISSVLAPMGITHVWKGDAATGAGDQVKSLVTVAVPETSAVTVNAAAVLPVRVTRKAMGSGPTSLPLASMASTFTTPSGVPLVKFLPVTEGPTTTGLVKPGVKVSASSTPVSV